MYSLIAAFSGALFALGLQIAGMTDPTKVIGFLNITKAWDPSLALVLASALLIFSLGYHFIAKPRLAQQKSTLLGTTFDLPNAKHVDRPLLMGASTFGVGWGLSGLCPGPAIANLALFDIKIVVFTILMLVGMALAKSWTKLNPSS